MAIKHSITLSTTEPNNEIGVIKIRQADEQTQMLDVQITENGVPKSYQGLTVYFCAKLGQTAGLGIIEQKLNPEEMTNPANGKLEYTMRAEDWQILGRQKGYFSFRKMKNEHEFIEQFTTRDFTFDVIKSVYSDGLKEVKKDGSTYIWTIEDMIRLFKEYISTGKIDWENYKNDERILWEKFVEDNREFLETADPGGKIILELLGARGGAQTLGERLDSEKAEFSTQLAQITYFSKDFNKRLRTGEAINVKVIGDSLTAGVGTNGYNLPNDTPIIFTDPIDNTAYLESNNSADNWANNFRELLTALNSNVTFEKWGIGGKSAKWFNARIRQVTDSEDIVFVMLGANDRWDSADIEEFKSELSSLVSYLKEISNQVVLMSSNPAQPSSDADKNFSMQDANSTIKAVASEMSVPFISHHDYIYEYVTKTGNAYNTLMADGTHVNSKGSNVIFESLQKSIVVFDQDNMLKGGNTVTIAEMHAYLADNVPSDFNDGITYNVVAGASNTVGFPGTGTNSGILMTNNTYNRNGFVYQIYNLYDRNEFYRRYWTSSGSWSDWEKANATDIVTGNDVFSSANVIGDFTSGKITYTPITYNNSSGFPASRAGLLITNRASTFGFQQYKHYDRNALYFRTWKGSEWSDWEQLVTIYPRENVSLSVGTIPAGQTVDIALVTEQTINQTFLLIMTCYRLLPDGIMYTQPMNDTSTNTYHVRFHNTTADDKVVGNVLVKFTQMQIY